MEGGASGLWRYLAATAAVSRLTGLIYVACVYVRGQKLEESESESSRVELERLAKRKQCMGEGGGTARAEEEGEGG